MFMHILYQLNISTRIVKTGLLHPTTENILTYLLYTHIVEGTDQQTKKFDWLMSVQWCLLNPCPQNHNKIPSINIVGLCQYCTSYMAAHWVKNRFKVFLTVSKPLRYNQPTKLRLFLAPHKKNCSWSTEILPAVPRGIAVLGSFSVADPRLCSCLPSFVQSVRSLIPLRVQQKSHLL